MGRAWGWVLLVFLALLSVACSTSDGALLGGFGPDASGSAISVAPARATAPEETTKASVRAAYISNGQAEARARPDYHVQMDDLGHAMRARNPAHQFETTFDARGATVRSAVGEWEARFETVAMGCGEKSFEVGGGRLDRVASEPNRVAAKRRAGDAEFHEWYVNGPLGLEQGFTLESSPCEAGGGEVRFETSVTGLRPELATGGAESGRGDVVLRDERGVARVSYSDAYAQDAKERALPVRLSVRGDRVEMAVELQGAEFPVRVDPLVWTEQQELVASGGAASDRFGDSVSVSGDTALVGAYWHSVGANALQGSAYAFVRNGVTWTQQGPPLTASDGAASDYFGLSLSVSGDTALVGAYWHSVGVNARQGSAYAFVRNGVTWTQQGPPLVAPDGAASDYFGVSVSLSGDTALVGAENHAGLGSAYVFVRNGLTWTRQGPPLVASDGQVGDFFGCSVSLSGDTALVGAYNHAGLGSAYVFVRNGLTWTQQGPPLVASDASAQLDALSFGSSVSVSGDTALVGASGRKVGGDRQGSAYVFVRNGVTWTQQEPPLVGSDSAPRDQFGSSVSVSGDTALVGAYAHGVVDAVGGAVFQGAAYSFVKNGVTWTQQGPPLVASDGQVGDTFGGSVSVSGDTALVGASRQFARNAHQGSAYVFALPGGACTANFQCGSGFCQDGFCCNTSCAGQCEACNLPSALGKCTKVIGPPVGTRGACAGSGSCGGKCDGTSSTCVFPNATVCEAASCADSTHALPTSTCDGKGNCVKGAAMSCANCAAGACEAFPDASSDGSSTTGVPGELDAATTDTSPDANDLIATAPRSDAGCGCRLEERGDRRGAASLALLGALAAFSRRQRTRSRRGANWEAR